MAGNKAERRHLEFIASRPCALCGAEPVEVHHIRTGVGMGQRSGHYLTIPLCPDCHRGPAGVHGDQSMMKVMKVTELQLLEREIEALWDYLLTKT